jgi:hypothetical protein
VNSPSRVMLALVLSLTAGKGESFASSSFEATFAVPADQVSSPANGDTARCPLGPADLDKLTPYRWQVAQYKADRGYIPNATIRIDYCELIGRDDKGTMRTGVMVNIAKGANADAFAKHWRAVCSGSIMPDARGKVQAVPGVAGGYQCVTAKGSSSAYWIESPGRTVQIEPEDVDPAWAKILPQLLAAVAR